MAIKSVSQLDEFENHTAETGSSAGVFAIGKSLALANQDLLTEDDKNCSKAAGWPDSFVADKNNEGKFDSLFEISETNNYGESDVNTTYNSRKITYANLVKNILWDVKAYLNWRNNLKDYNLSRIVDGDQVFNGNKTFANDISVGGNLSTYGNAYFNNVYVYNRLSSNIIKSNDVSVGNCSIINLCATNEIVDNLTISNSLSIGNIRQIMTTNPNMFICAWAYGLKNDAEQKITEPSANVISGSEYTKVGDPIWFLNGQPIHLSCVNYANYAYNLVSSNGLPYNVGTAGLSTSMGGYDLPGFKPQHTVVRIKNGIPVECNEIDFAHHALWSDLGERYLADAKYEPGTLVKFGGEKEITIADTEVNAIVSTKAFDLNAMLHNGTTIALCGRVPTKVKGKISKFDKIMLSDTPGIACKWDGHSKVIGRSLETNLNEQIKLVECVTQFNI